MKINKKRTALAHLKKAEDVNWPGLHGSQCPRGLAVDLPVGVAVIVADCDREPAVVGPDDVHV